MKNIYLVRHCEAEGQQPEAKLTKRGVQQAEELARFFAEHPVEQMISSPFTRALQTAEPLAEKKQLQIEIDSRLSERILSTDDLPDWLEKLELTFHNPDLAFAGGESSRVAMKRVVTVIDEVLTRNTNHTVIVTHGNLLTLLLRHYDPHYGFLAWKALSNPDVFLLQLYNAQTFVKRIWASKSD